MTDSQRLVERATRGEAVAVEALMQRHLPGLRAFIRLHSPPAVRDKESSSDLVQSVCLEVLQSLEGFEYRGEAAFRAWLFTMALSKVQDRARFYGAQRRDAAREISVRDARDEYAPFYASLVTPSRVAMGRESMERLESAFDELTEGQRTVVGLSRIVGFTVREIAARLGRSEEAVRSLLKRGLARLIWIMSRYELDES